MPQELLQYRSLSHGDLRASAWRATTCLLAVGLVHLFSGLLLGVVTVLDSTADVVPGIIPVGRLSDIAPFFDDGVMHLAMAFAYLVFARVVRGRGWVLTAMIVTSLLLGAVAIAMVEDVLSQALGAFHAAGVLLGIQLAIDLLLHVCLVLVLLEVLQADADRRISAADPVAAAAAARRLNKDTGAEPEPPRVRPWRLPKTWEKHDDHDS